MPLGTFMGLATNAYNNYMANEREQQARAENFKYNELSAENADKRLRALYNDLYSPSAQVAQLRAAGLSPSLFFGGQGASGMSVNPHGAQGQGAGGINPNVHFIDPLTAAQIENIKADTRSKNVESDTKEGKNEFGQATIQKLLAENGKIKAEHAYIDLQGEWQKLNNEFFTEGKQFNLETLKQTARQLEQSANYMQWQAKREHLQYDFENETFEKRKKEIETRVNNIIQDTATKLAQELLAKNNIKVNNEQIKLIQEQTKQLANNYHLNIIKLGLEGQQVQISRAQQKALEDYQKDMVELYQKQFSINAKDWFNGTTDILKSVINAGATIGSMYLLKGVKLPMAATPIMWGQGDNTFHENYY